MPVTLTSGGAGVGSSADDATGEGFSNDVAPIDPSVAAKYEGGSASYKLSAKVSLTMPSSGYLTGQGLACIAGGPDPLFTSANCWYNGARWFDGPSPTDQ